MLSFNIFSFFFLQSICILRIVGSLSPYFYYSYTSIFLINVSFCIRLFDLGSSIKDVRSKGEVCVPLWTTSDGGGWGGWKLAMNRTSTNKLLFAFWESVLKSDTPPPSPVHGHPDCNIFCVSDVFTRKYSTDVCGRGGGVSSKRTMLDRGGVCEGAFDGWPLI